MKNFKLLLALAFSIPISMKAQTISGFYQQIVKMKDGTELRIVPDESSYSEVSRKVNNDNRFLTVKTKEKSYTLDANLVSSIGFYYYVPEEHTLNKEIESLHRYSLFVEALKRTALMDTIATISSKTCEFTMLPFGNLQNPYPANECRRGYTVFAESDSVMHLHGINSFEDLVAYANRIYANAAEWYDYLGVNNLSVSTGDDYTNRQNALNMFVAYHIVNAAIPANWLVYECTNSLYWNCKPDASPYDYYETMLPSTLVKVWQPYPTNRIFLNRYLTNNTLTDVAETTGSTAIHELKREGAEVLKGENMIEAYNGYVHSIGDMLVYDEVVPHGVLNERMRFNCTSLMPELITNGWRQYSAGELPDGEHDKNCGGIPLSYSDNILFKNTGLCMEYLVHGAYSNYQSDGFLIWGNGRDFDLSIKLPPVPAGKYEIRLPYSPSLTSGVVQFYWGNDNQNMIPQGIPVDFRVEATDPRIGWTSYLDEADNGIASDRMLRNMGYMRGSFLYCGYGEQGWSEINNCRAGGTLRKIIGQVTMNGQSSWLRIRGIIEGDMMFSLDCIELCPVSVYKNEEYSEDWY